MNGPPAGTIARKRADTAEPAPTVRTARVAQGAPGPQAGLDFASLRAEAIAHAQALAGDQWTDYNLHDPGVTFLEQFCYALTELVYRADAPLADQLCGADGQIDFAALGLHPPAEVLPCRATTAADLRRVLIDRVPGLADALLHPVAPDGIPLWRLTLELAPGQHDEAAALAAARAAFRAQRALGEDLDHTVDFVGQRRCQLQAQIDIAGARDPAEILAEVYDRLARHIAGVQRPRGLAELLAAGHGAEDIWDGPALQHGFLPDAGTRQSQLFVADLADELRRIDGVREVHALGLRLNGEAQARTHALEWRGERDALVLCVPGQGADTSLVRLSRRGQPLQLDADDVAAEYADRQTGSDPGAGTPSAGDWALPRGRPREAQHYFSVQAQLPAVYTRAARGDAAAQARSAQLRAYLAIYEQALANAGVQLQHLRELFAVDGDARCSYWWHVLDDASLPGIESLYLGPAAEIGQQAFGEHDDAAERRQRALDSVLALHGQVYTQNSMRQFLGHLEPQELKARLLSNKAAFTRALIAVARDRAGGFDAGATAWDGSANVSGLQRNVALLLGLADGSSRSLCAPFERQRSRPVAAVRMPTATPSSIAAGSERVTVADRSLLRALARPAGARSGDSQRADLQSFGLGRGELPAEWLSLGVERGRYRWRALDGSRGELLLGPDADGLWWRLGDFADETAAAAAADTLRRWLLRLNDLGEGLHVVEHVLLRPRSAGAPQHGLGVGAGFHALRLTVVFPAWTVRTRLAGFRAFADETVQINTPAHLSAQCLWLDFDEMQAFEAAFQAWLEALRRFFADPGQPAAAEAADVAACDVITLLLAHGVPRD
jgi:hypothetical protein